MLYVETSLWGKAVVPKVLLVMAWDAALRQKVVKQFSSKEKISGVGNTPF